MPHAPRMIPWKRIFGRLLLAFWAMLALVLFLLMGGGRFGPSPSSPRFRRSVAISDMRSIATALESYHSDHGQYPATRPLAEFAGAAPDLLAAAGGSALATFEPGLGDALHGLTTPVAYFDSLYYDPFTGHPRSRWFSGDTPRIPREGAWPFAYHASADGTGWILWSPGPDGVYDLRDPAGTYLPRKGHNPKLIELTYDPTNGRTSPGDVIREMR